MTSRLLWCLGVLVALLFAASLLWWNGGIAGEVFLLTRDGTPMPAAGAKLYLMENTKELGLAALYASNEWRSLSERDSERLNKLRQVAPTAERLEELKFTKEAFCHEAGLILMKHFRAARLQETLDKDGKFFVRVLPGTHGIWVSGQAGHERAEWLETVDVTFRRVIRLSEPMCRYEM
ncbi:MAG: hypothetical protein L0Z53_03455 [Acidobacteriales bacterium]|nr:hypothetical protein [Terriglobales bacterium]